MKKCMCKKGECFCGKKLDTTSPEYMLSEKTYHTLNSLEEEVALSKIVNIIRMVFYIVGIILGVLLIVHLFSSLK